MQMRKLAFQSAKQIGVILERQFRIQTADNMQFRRAFRNGVSGNIDAFVNRMRVCALLPGAFVKPAKFTIGDADVRVIEMPVDVKISRPPVLFPPHKIGEFAERVQIVGFIQRDAFFKVKTLARLDFSGDKI
jgi:hypothetical protein